MRYLATYIFIFLVFIGSSQDRKIIFPDIPGYETLVCDFHQHTVFSDGSVWPDIRVREAILDGVDAISLTEHIEYQPHATDIPHPDRNRSYELAKEYAEGKDLLVIHGVEITREMPPGHSNALFVRDANELLIDDPLEVFRVAKAQGAFTFWNHPNWTSQRSDGIATLTDLHRTLISENLLDGIEVVNENTLSMEAFSIAQENNLTVMSTSDIHGLIDWLFEIPDGGHRPVTLVFAQSKTEDAIKEALIAGRTVAWFQNNLVGNEENLIPLLVSSIEVQGAAYQENTQVLNVDFSNVSDATFILQNTSDYTFHASSNLIQIPPGKFTLQVKTLKELTSVNLTFKVLNAFQEPGRNPNIDFVIEPR